LPAKVGFGWRLVGGAEVAHVGLGVGDGVTAGGAWGRARVVDIARISNRE
jgi:hypothetical protein